MHTARGLDVASMLGLSFFSLPLPLFFSLSRAIIAVGGSPLRGEAPGFIRRSPRGHVVNHVDDAKTEGERADAGRSSAPVV